ncbi:MAG: ImpA-related N-terminal family [Pseudomonas sp.]|nr:ImpA-related N-terminal family [Pseudomonas sp.]
MPDVINDLSLAVLRAPLDGGGGEDLSFSSLFDQIKEARRSDADYLTQGDWQTDFKQSNWDQVITLAATGLTEKSKDLMLVAWLTEGLTHQHHFKGLSFGLALAHALLSDLWDDLFPAVEEGTEERAAQLGWLNTTLSNVVGVLPITQGQGYGLLKYDEARQVENLARQNPTAMTVALEEGKVNAELFQRSATQTETEHLQRKHAEISESLDACRQLQASIDALFDNDAPTFSILDDTLTRARQLVERLLGERGIDLIETAPVATQPTQQPADEKPVNAHLAEPWTAGNTAMRSVPLTREEAFTMLNGVAQFFKQSEPHSPVPYLIERAVKWGGMPLESWLKDVIKDVSVVDGIRDVLGTKDARA